MNFQCLKTRIWECSIKLLYFSLSRHSTVLEQFWVLLGPFFTLRSCQVFLSLAKEFKFIWYIWWIICCNSNTYCNCLLCNIQLKQQSPPLESNVRNSYGITILFNDNVQNFFQMKRNLKVTRKSLFTIFSSCISYSVFDRATILNIRSEHCKVLTPLTVPNNLKRINK